eukprot:4622446-Pyramimonas_sp.AAC.1
MLRHVPIAHCCGSQESEGLPTKEASRAAEVSMHAAVRAGALYPEGGQRLPVGRRAVQLDGLCQVQEAGRRLQVGRSYGGLPGAVREEG